MKKLVLISALIISSFGIRSMQVVLQHPASAVKQVSIVEKMAWQKREAEVEADKLDISALETAILSNGINNQFDIVISKLNENIFIGKGVVPIRAYRNRLATRLLSFIGDQQKAAAIALPDAILKSSIICYYASGMFNTDQRSLFFQYVFPLIKKAFSPKTSEEFTKNVIKSWNDVYTWFNERSTTLEEAKDVRNYLDGHGILNEETR